MHRQNPEMMKKQRKSALRTLYRLSKECSSNESYFTGECISEHWLYEEQHGNIKEARRAGMVCRHDIQELFDQYIQAGLIKRVLIGNTTGYRVDLTKEDKIRELL